MKVDKDKLIQKRQFKPGDIMSKITADENRGFTETFYDFQANWDYLFQLLAANPKIIDDLLFEANQLLAEANILCDFCVGAFGIVRNGGNFSERSFMSQRYYFTLQVYAESYLESSLRADFFVGKNDFIFRVMAQSKTEEDPSNAGQD